MEYNYFTISETSRMIVVGNIQFILDSGEDGLPEHAKMIEDFDSDESKLVHFVDLLVKDPNTAFLKYNGL